MVGPVLKQTEEYRTIQLTPDVTVKLHRSIPDSVHFSVGIDDSMVKRVQPLQALASWRDGTRIRYGWDSDRDFYVDYKTPRSCCYRVYYTLFLSYALQAVNKPLVVYGLSCNVDGTITWRIVIGASAIKWMGPVSEWFLMGQAKMQYVG
jgi:hypothetical protein